MALFLTLPLLPSAQAQDGGTPRWQKRYISVAGAWFLERRCRFLSTADRRELEWSTAQITLAIARREGLAVVRRLQDGALRLISQPDFKGCGANNRRIVEEGRGWARTDLTLLTGRIYDRDSSYRDYALARFAAAVARAGAEARCKHLPAEERGQLSALVTAVAAGLGEAYGVATVCRAMKRATDAAARDRTPCGPVTQGRLAAAIQDLRELKREFGATR